MDYWNKLNHADGQAAPRAAFHEEWERQFRFLPIDRQEVIVSNSMCREADLLFESVEAELLRREAAEE